MSRPIKLSIEQAEAFKREFADILAAGTFPEGEIKFSKKFETCKNKATLYFKEKAWQKMTCLVDEIDKEVAWHGIAKRYDNDGENAAYIIEDILVYPQKVTGATVTTDQVEYQTWLMDRDDDEFNNIRMQGHSHVNMSTSPSTVDLTLYDQIISQLTDDMFYIFLIINKRNEKTIKIYDFRDNIAYETADVETKVLMAPDGVMKFVEDAKKLVVEEKPVAQSYYSPYPHYYSGYTGKAGEVTTSSAVTSSTTNVSTAAKSTGTSPTSTVKCQSKTKEEKEMFTGRRGCNIYDDDDEFYDQMYNARFARKA